MINKKGMALNEDSVKGGGGTCGHKHRNILFEPRYLAEPCPSPVEYFSRPAKGFSGPAKNCKKKTFIDNWLNKEKIQKLKRGGIIYHSNRKAFIKNV